MVLSMHDVCSYFKNKKITVAGLGLLGRGVGDVEFLASCGADLIVTDLKTEATLKPSLDRLRQYTNITYTLGEHREEDFVGRDFILKGPTVPFSSTFIRVAQKEGTPIKMSASWFAERAGIPVVGVTGTRGKTTTTYMLYDMMKAAGMDVLLGGNIRGVSTLALLPQVNKESIALMELDSWQCEGFGEARISPNIAVFTSFMEDHMDYYGGDEDAYFDAKAQIFLHQTESDTLIAPPTVLQRIQERYKARVRSHVVTADSAKGSEAWMQPPLKGEHNAQNARCAIEAARTLGIDDEVISEALAAFKAVPGRLELIREVNGVAFYNDTTATTPEAAIAALRALSKECNTVVLIAGGNDKGLGVDALIQAIQEHAGHVVLLAGTGTEKIKDSFKEIMIYHNLRDAFDSAVSNARPGDAVLLSPGFTSFGMFENEYDRGDQFNALVKKL